jgi:hypothetical protein
MEKSNNSNSKRRPVKALILADIKKRGSETKNETVLLKGLDVKNALRRINTKALGEQISDDNAVDLATLMRKFVDDVNKLL